MIETSEKVKESIDTQQNKLIEQLQKNQLALTEGLNKNRLAITSGFDKMDEVKKWDLSQLPGYEATLDAIEEPEKEGKAEDINEKIKEIDELIKENLIISHDIYDSANKAKEEGNEELNKYYLNKIKELDENYKLLKKERERLQEISGENDEEEEDFEEDIEKKQEPPGRVIRFDDTDLDSGINIASSIKFLENDLPLPRRIQNESHKTIKKYQRKAERLANQYKGILANKAEFKISKGKNIAVSLNKNPRTETLQESRYFNILGEYVNNMNKLENIVRKKEGKGVIHFNNPQKLVDRLELLAGSIFAGNNGVKQEFSQIAHLLHQLQVITKKTLNDLLKKYILFK